MATTPEVFAAPAPALPHRRARDRRATIFRVIAGLVSLGLLFGGMIVLFMLAPWVLIGPTPDDYMAEIHRWHHADVGALFGFLVAGSLLALIPNPRRRPVLAQAAVIGLGAMLVASLFDELSVGAIAIPVVVTGIIVAAYPAPRALVFLRRDASVSLPLLALAAATAIPLIVNAWDNLRMQAEDHSQHAAESHWSGSAAVAVALILTGLLVASRRPGWRTLGALLGVTYVYLGAAAVTIPDHDGSWGIGGGILALVAGGAFLAAVVFDWRRTSRSAASLAKTGTLADGETYERGQD